MSSSFYIVFWLSLYLKMEIIKIFGFVFIDKIIEFKSKICNDPTQPNLMSIQLLISLVRELDVQLYRTNSNIIR